MTPLPDGHAWATTARRSKQKGQRIDSTSTLIYARA